jgi:alkanesulfonate monooxygenase SsuD/methylene tetrahydromethanopterin reductase-like flavin-dependent oxidoreductase (luciferase family)
VQQPHPPIVIGASPTDLHFAHITEYGDAWMPIEGRWSIADSWQRLQAYAADHGRDPATLQLGVFGAKATVEHLAELRDLGTSYVALGPSPRSSATSRCSPSSTETPRSRPSTSVGARGVG